MVVDRDRKFAMPFYLVCDVSTAMYDEMDVLHREVTQIWEMIKGGITDDVIFICVMTFADQADVLVRLTQMSECDGIPEFVYGDQAHYGVAFRKLARVIEQGCAGLNRAGWRIYPPCVYFLTDGDPHDDDWYDTFRRTLTDRSSLPSNLISVGVPARNPLIFVPFGFGDARVNTLRKMAYPPSVSRWYHNSSDKFEDAVSELLELIGKSLGDSGMSSMTGRPEHIMPVPEPGSSTAYGYA